MLLFFAMMLTKAYYIPAMNLPERPYLPGSASGNPQLVPLGRYLPPYAAGMLTRWLSDNLSAGQWLLDPLNSHPAPVLEAARAGYRVLAVCNNPILAFMLEVLAAAPDTAAFQSALAELGAARRGDERLETHIQALYESECPNCTARIQPQAFLWRRGETLPFARLQHCPHCSTEGEFPITTADLAALTRLGSDSLHRSRAVERVLPIDDPDRLAVDEVLKSYLPRPLYVLFTLLNKSEGLAIGTERRRLLTALILSLCDEASSLWTWHSARSRPRQINIPPVFRENNLWLALDNAVQVWAQAGAAVPLVHWPELPPESGGICLYPGRLRNLMPLPNTIRPAAAFGLLPRPNQAFWTFSPLWTGWLWGREAAQPLKRSFERRRYDWHWHAAALHSAFAVLNSTTPAGFLFFAILTEVATGFLAAAISAAQAAGLSFNGLALRSDEQTAQIWWLSARARPQRPSIHLDALARQGIHDYLTRRGQPANYLELAAAAFFTAAENNGLPAAQQQVDNRTLDALLGAVSSAAQDENFLTRYQGSPGSSESGQWWLAQPVAPARPLLERIESDLLRRLETAPAAAANLDAAICAAFPGLLTPPLDWLLTCLDAYAAADPNNPESFTLQAEARSAARNALLETMQTHLRALAAGLKMECSGSEPMLWKTQSGAPQYAFYLTDTAAAASLLLKPPLPGAQRVLVYPENRTKLLSAAWQRDPRISEDVFSTWRFLKFEALHQFGDSGIPSLDALEKLLTSKIAYR